MLAFSVKNRSFYAVSKLPAKGDILHFLRKSAKIPDICRENDYKIIKELQNNKKALDFSKASLYQTCVLILVRLSEKSSPDQCKNPLSHGSSF
jgi:hypothetical protein